MGQGGQVPRSGVEEGVGGGGGGGQDHGVDDGGQDGDAGTVDGDDPWGLRGTGGSAGLRAQQVRVVVGHEHADGEGAQDVEEQDAPEDSAHGLGDVLARVLGLTGRDGDHLDASVGEGGVDEGGEETEEASGVGVGADVQFHRTRVLPVPEADAVVRGRSAQVDADGHDQQADDGDDLDAGEDELGLAVDGNGEDVQADDDDDDDGDPRRDVDAHGALPELNDERGGGDLRTERDGGRVPVVPADGEAQRSIDVASAELRDGTGER